MAETNRNPDVSRALRPPVVAPSQNAGEQILRGVGELGEMGIKMRHEGLMRDVEEDVLGLQEEFLSSQEQDSYEESLADLNPSERSVVDYFVDLQAKLQAAERQGVTPLMHLKIKQEKVLREYMTKYPQLSGYFQQAASGVLGYNPIGAELEARAAAETARQGAMGDLLARVHRAADAAGVPPYLQHTNPRAYWDKAIQAMDEAEQVAQAERKHQLREFTKSKTGDSLIRDIRTAVPAYVGFFVREIQPIINDVATLTPEERKEWLKDGRLEAFQVDLKQRREAIVLDFYNRYAVGAEGVTPERMEQELKPILQLYDYAIEKASSERLSKDLENLKTGIQNHSISTLPENIHALEYLANTMDRITALGNLSAKEINVETSREVAAWLNRMSGGRSPAPLPTEPAVDQEGRFNPGVQDGRFFTPDEFPNEEAAYRFYYENAVTIATSALSTIQNKDAPPEVQAVAQAHLVGLLTNWGNLYTHYYKKYPGNAQLPEAISNAYLRVTGNPVMADMVRENSMFQDVLVNSFSTMLQTELRDEYKAMQDLFDSEKIFRWQQGRGDQMFGQSRTSPISDVVAADWSSGEMLFVLRPGLPEELKAKGQEYVDKLNTSKYRNRVALLIQTDAHIRGQSGPAAYAAAANQMFKAQGG